MLRLLLKMLLADTVRRIERNDVIFLGILQHRGNCFEVFLHSSFLDAISTTPWALAQFLAHFFKRHGQQFCKRNTANQRVNNVKVSLIACVGSSFEKRFLPFEPIFRVLIKVGLLAFLDTILELFLDAFRFSHDILLDATLWHG